ncbi:MAG: O-antigen ligase family protein [Bacteroides intestinalis]
MDSSAHIPYAPIGKAPQNPIPGPISRSGIVPFLLGAPYFLKKESADARLFIWKNSGQLLYTSPLTGSGVNTFASRYMYTQAEYFANHPDSPYKLKASDNSHAFNEYLRIIVEYGIIGLILLLLLFS